MTNESIRESNRESNREYIRESDIPRYLHTAFPSHTILHTYTKSHLLIKASLADFMSAPIHNWEYNRPPDINRCEDISHYYSAKPVETVFYVAFNSKKNCYDILDGIHRYTALKMIHKKFPADYVDFITESTVSDPMYTVLLNIRFNAFEEDLIGFFRSINKANPVHELYLRDTAKDKRDAIEAVVSNWTKRFKAHFSLATKPQKPHVNNNQFTELLSKVWDKYHLTLETSLQLGEKLETANERVKNELMAEDVNAAMRKKCDTTGCWIFMYKMETLEKIV